MATSAAARLPPEILEEIIQYFGPLSILRDLQSEYRQEAKSVLAACSLVCRYWAHKCRPKAFDCIQMRVKGSRTIYDGRESLRSLSSLVSQTPQTLKAVSEYVKTLHLYRDISSGNWYDSAKFNTNHILQLSEDQIDTYGTCAVFLPHAEIYAHTDMYNYVPVQVGYRGPIADTFRVPQNLPLFCHRIILERVYVSWLPGFLYSLLRSLRCIGTSVNLEMTEVYWRNSRGESRSVLPLLDVNMKISARNCTSHAELVWSVFTMMERSSIYYLDPVGERPSILLLYSPDLEIMSSISQVLHTGICSSETPGYYDYTLRLQVSRGPLNELDVEDDLICAVSVHRMEDPRPIAVILEFFAAGGRRLTHNVWEVGWDAGQHEFVRKVVLRFKPFQYEPDWLIEHIVHACWADLFELLLQLKEIKCVELLFAEYSDLVKFVRAQSEALQMLENLGKLRYDAPCEGVNEVHLHTRHDVEMCTIDSEVGVIVQGSTEVKVRPDEEL
ncbi:hypothetical protein BDW22DRAFT_1342380 [Trametopsis cervina]|nr:hypothetical protein BDW22DRAFT_1342380 [Trametopsis cervina]